MTAKDLLLHEFPLHGTRLIEASAGTGKTYTISALYVRLVLGHGLDDTPWAGGLMPPRILVVTFTKAATEELRDRIRQRLQSSADALMADRPPKDPLLAGIAADWPDDIRRDAILRLRRAAEWMDEAAIHTIHAWCQRMLKQHAFDSGNLFNAELEQDETELRLDAVRDYWRTFVYGLDPDIYGLLRSHWSTPEALDADVVRLLDRLEALGPPVSATSLAELIEPPLRERQTRQDTLRAKWRGWVDELDALLVSARNPKVLNGNKLRSAKGALDAIRAWLDDPAALTIDGLKAEQHWYQISPDGVAEATKDGQTPPQHPALEAVAELQAATAPLSVRTPALRHALYWIAERLDSSKRQRAAMTFQDLLVRLDRALAGQNGERLADTIRQQFPLALIDEFQDTDPVQYRIYRCIYGNRPDAGLFMIGDPKQAIYGFRGGDIFTYLAARTDAEPPVFTLPRNFRSTQAMVDAVNCLFNYPNRSEDYRHGPFALPAISFQPVAAQGRDETLQVRGREQPALTVWYSDGEPLSQGDYRELMAARAAETIVDLLNGAATGAAVFKTAEGEQPVRAGDIAVLVRGRTEAHAIRQALGARGVASVYLSDRDSVYATAEAGDILRLLLAVAEPENERRLRAALATRLLALDLADLDRLAADDLAWEAQVEQFRVWRRLWRERGVLALLRRLLDAFGAPARILAGGDGERRLTNTLQLAELLQQAAARLDGPLALIRYLEEHIRQALAGPDQAAEHTLRLESEAELVQVVTQHGAKGLEYPLVFLPFAAATRPYNAADESAVIFHQGHDLRIDLDKAEASAEQAAREDLSEQLRLLYVAVTRARHACWLGVAPLLHQRRPVLHRGALGYLLGAGREITPEALAHCLEQLRGDTAAIALEKIDPVAPAVTPLQAHAENTVLRPPRTAHRRTGRRWWITSYSAILEGAGARGGDAETADTVPQAEDSAEESADEANLKELAREADAGVPGPGAGAGGPDLHGFPKGSRSGNFLHDILEWIAGEGFDRTVANPDALGAELARRCGRRGLDEWTDILHQGLIRLLDTPLPLPDGQAAVALGALPPPQIQAELEFWFTTRETPTEAIDGLVRAHILAGRSRPRLLPQTLNGMFKGFVDLVFEHDGRYYVVDYKSNWLGEDDAAYTDDAMNAAILEHRYDLQYSLYTLALHRLLKARLPDYDYERHLGGILYLFLRGVRANGLGVHRCRPPRVLIEQLDELMRRPEVTDA